MMVNHSAFAENIRIKALSYDDALTLQRDGRWTARVLQIFDNALTLIDSSGAPVSLLDSSRKNGPSRIILEMPRRRIFRNWPICNDSCFIMHGSCLCDSSFQVFIDLSAAERWSLPAALSAPLLAPGDILNNVRLCCGYLAGHSADDDRHFFSSASELIDGRMPCTAAEKDGSVYGRLLILLAALYQHLEGRSGLLSGDPAMGMLGLGRGLTPSGDDLLCGILCALHVCRMVHLLSPLHEEFLSSLTGCIGCCRERTTFLSHSFLIWAGEGRCSEEVFSLCEKILTEKSLDIGKWGAPFLAMGASSGREVMLGALAAIGALCRQQLNGKEDDCSG